MEVLREGGRKDSEREAVLGLILNINLLVIDLLKAGKMDAPGKKLYELLRVKMTKITLRTSLSFSRNDKRVMNNKKNIKQ